MDWQTLLAVAAIAVAGLTLLARLLDKSLTVREHDEYRKGMERHAETTRLQLVRDIDRLEKQLSILEQTRPTTGELKTTADNVKEQIAEIKARLREFSKSQ